MATPQGLPEATEIWSARTSANANGKRTAHREWMVINVTTDVDAINTVPEAAINQQHPWWSNVKVETNGVSNVENGGPFAWKVTADYSIPDDGQNQDNNRDAQKDDPLNQPPEYNWDDQDVSFPTDRDYDKNPIINSAVDAFDPPDEISKKAIIYAVTWNVATFNGKDAEAMGNMLCAGQFKTIFGTYSKGEVQLKSFKPSEPVIGKTPKYVRVTATYEIRSRANWPCPADATPFDTRHLDQGFDSFRLQNGGPVPVEIRFSDNSKPSAPVRLDGGGGPLKASNFRPFSGGSGFQSIASPKGAIIEKTADAVFLWYRHYGFSDIGGMLP